MSLISERIKELEERRRILGLDMDIFDDILFAQITELRALAPKINEIFVAINGSCEQKYEHCDCARIFLKELTEGV